MTLKRPDDSSFSLKSIDMCNFNAQVLAQTVVINGVLSGGGKVSHTVVTPSTSVIYNTYTLSSTFSNLVSGVLGNGLVVTTNVKLT